MNFVFAEAVEVGGEVVGVWAVVPPVEGEGGVEGDEFLGGGDVAGVDFGEEFGAVTLGEGVGVYVADEGFELFECTVGGIFGGLPGIEGFADFAEAEEAFGAEAEGGGEVGVGFGVEGVGVGGAGVFAGAVLFHGPFELGVGFVGEGLGGAFVEGVGRFGVHFEKDVGEEEVLGEVRVRIRGKAARIFALGFVEMALGDERAGFGEDGWETFGFLFDVGREIGKSGSGKEGRAAVTSRVRSCMGGIMVEVWKESKLKTGIWGGNQLRGEQDC